MGAAAILIPFGPGEIETLDAVKELTNQHGHQVRIQANISDWIVTIRSLVETSAELTEIYIEIS